jgi:hypothetical protein
MLTRTFVTAFFVPSWLRRRTLIFASSIALLGAYGNARASVIFNDFGAGNSYSTTGGWAVFGTGRGAQTMPFMPVDNFTLTQIDVTLFGNGSAPTAATLTLNSDNGGVPVTILVTWTLNNLPTGPSCCTVETETPTGTILLATNGARPLSISR